MIQLIWKKKVNVPTTKCAMKLQLSSVTENIHRGSEGNTCPKYLTLLSPVFKNIYLYSRTFTEDQKKTPALNISLYFFTFTYVQDGEFTEDQKETCLL